MGKPGLTRRNLAALVAAMPLMAQVSTTPPNPTPLSAAPNAAKAADDVRKVSERLAQSDVPMDVEPAFSFHA